MDICNCINWHSPTTGTRLCSYCGKHMENQTEYEKRKIAESEHKEGGIEG